MTPVLYRRLSIANTLNITEVKKILFFVFFCDGEFLSLLAMLFTHESDGREGFKINEL